METQKKSDTINGLRPNIHIVDELDECFYGVDPEQVKKIWEEARPKLDLKIKPILLISGNKNLF